MSNFTLDAMTSARQSDVLGILLGHIMLKYFSHLFCTCLIARKSDVVPQLNKNEQNDEWPIFVWILQDEESIDGDLLIKRIDLGCRSFIISNQLAIDFIELFDLIRDDCKQHLRDIRIAVVKFSDNTEDTNNALVRSPMIVELPMTIVVQPSSNSPDDIYDILTTEIYGENIIPSLYLLDQYYGSNHSFHLNNNLFPDKMHSLNKHHIRLAIFNYKPYTIWKKVAPGTGNAHLLGSDEYNSLDIDGTETLMMLEFCYKFNCSWEISPDDVGEWGSVTENKTGDGIIGAVVEKRADIGVGALYVWYRESQYLALSTPISRTGITCIVLKPRLVSGWFIAVSPFAYFLWLAVFASVLLATISLAVVMKIRKLTAMPLGDQKTVDELSFLVYKVYLWQSVKIISAEFSDLFIYGCILVISLMIGNAYSSKLAAVMTVPRYEPAIETVEELANSHIQWSATHDAWIFSILKATEPVIVKVLSKFKIFSEPELKYKMRNGELGFSIERLPYGHFAIGEYVVEDAVDNYQIMKEDIYWEYCVAMSSKTWPFLPQFDDLVLRIAESGIQKYWELKVVMHVMNNKVQLSVASTILKSNDNTGPVKLEVQHLIGVFCLWWIGIGGAVVIFLFEVCWYYLYVSRKIQS